MYNILTWIPNTSDFYINKLMGTITAIMSNKPKLTLKVCLQNESQEHNHWWVCSCAEAYSVLNISYTFILVWLLGYLQYQKVLFLPWLRALWLVEMEWQARGKLCPWLWSSCWCSSEPDLKGTPWWPHLPTSIIYKFSHLLMKRSTKLLYICYLLDEPGL